MFPGFFLLPCSYAINNSILFQHFFGMVREAGGNNDHPDPLMFILIFRLMSVYSLVKPPKGSNITGGDLLKSLVFMKDAGLNSKDKEKKRWQKIHEEILESGGWLKMFFISVQL